MHFETPFKVVGDAGVKRSIAAFQDIKRPIVRAFPAYGGTPPIFGGGFLASGSFSFFLEPCKHSFVGGMHLENRKEYGSTRTV